MATYGGGVEFTSSLASVDVSAASQNVLYQPATGKYGEFKPLSFNPVGGAASGAITFEIQNSDGAGGWVIESTFTTTLGSTAFASPVQIDSYSVGNQSAPIKVMYGQRVTGRNLKGSTHRFTYTINEFYPSSAA